jgi:hypothetical protein
MNLRWMLGFEWLRRDAPLDGHCAWHMSLLYSSNLRPLAHTGIIGPLVLGCVFLRPRSVCTSMRRWMMMACTCALTFYMVHLETVFYWGLMGHEVVPCEKGISPWSHSHGMMSKKCILKVIGFMTSCIPNMEQAKWPCTKKWMRWFSEYMFKIGSFGVFLHVWHSSFVAM